MVCLVDTSQVAIEAPEVVQVVARNVAKTVAMHIEENARDLQSWKDKAMFIIIMSIKDYLISYVANAIGSKDC